MEVVTEVGMKITICNPMVPNGAIIELTADSSELMYYIRLLNNSPTNGKGEEEELDLPSETINGNEQERCDIQESDVHLCGGCQYNTGNPLMCGYYPAATQKKEDGQYITIICEQFEPHPELE